MSLRLRRADCGHWIPIDVDPAGVTADSGHSEQPVYLCGDCLDIARHLLAPKVEAKVVEPKPNISPGVELGWIPTPVHSSGASENADEYEYGRRAFLTGKSQGDNPYDRRTKAGKAWEQGYADAEEQGRH